MLSYKQWKNLNESILPSFNLGLANPSKIGMVMQNGFDIEENELAEAKKGKKHPKVEVEVKEEDKDGKKTCGKMCGKNCGKMCGKMSKKKMWSDEDDNYEDEEETEEDSEEEEEGDDSEEETEEDADEEGDDSEEEEEEEEEEADEDDSEEDTEEDENDAEAEAEMKFSKKSKKKMLKGAQKKLDLNKNGKLDAEDFEMLRKKKKMKKEETEWWNSVNGMISDPAQKFDDGFGGIFQSQHFTPVDVDNLTVAVREPAPGEVGFAPSGKIATSFGMDLKEAAWFKPQNWRDDGDKYVLKGKDGKERVFSDLAQANAATEDHGGKAVKRDKGWVVVVMKKVPTGEQLKDKGSFSSSHYDMDSVGKPLNAERKAAKVGKRKKLTDKN